MSDLPRLADTWDIRWIPMDIFEWCRIWYDILDVRKIHLYFCIYEEIWNPTLLYKQILIHTKRYGCIYPILGGCYLILTDIEIWCCILLYIIWCCRILSDMAGFRRISSDMPRCRRISSDMAGCRRISSDMDGCRRILSDMAGCRQISSDMAGCHRIWADVVGYCLIWLDVTWYHRIWPDVIGYGRVS